MCRYMNVEKVEYHETALEFAVRKFKRSAVELLKKAEKAEAEKAEKAQVIPFRGCSVWRL